MHARKGGIQSSGDKRMHGTRPGADASDVVRTVVRHRREACIIVQAEASSEIVLGAGMADERRKQQAAWKGE